MDPLTHTLTGLMLSRAGLRRWYPRPAILLMLAANVPDIDIVSSFHGSLAYLGCHRGLTHSIAASPLMAVLPVLLVCGFSRSFRNWRGALWISWIAVLSHLLLDWTNAYGIRLFLPFSPRWLALDITNVFDIWIWAALLLGLFAPILSRLVSGEIGDKINTGRGAAVTALLFVLLYNGGRVLLHERACDVLEWRLYQGVPPLRFSAIPNAALPWRWDAIVETPEFYVRAPVDLLNQFDPSAGRIVYKTPSSPPIEAARQTPAFRGLLAFARYPAWSVAPSGQGDGSVRVQLRDLRFPFFATAVVDAASRVQSASFHF